MLYDAIWVNAKLATMRPDSRYGAVLDGAIATRSGKIGWVGERIALSGAPERLAGAVHDARGAWITPGLVDCHTHLVYGGDRADEFELRLQGASYEDIAKAGGGIVSTVRHTRAASEDELTAAAARRLKQWLREGVTTIEIKSGYGLERDAELKMLRAARRLGETHPLTVKTTFLGAHALPEEYRGRADEYITLVCEEMLPPATREGLADAVDAFCEGIAFSPVQTARVFEAARRYALPVKLHADQLSDLDGAALAARYGALSADHLEYSNEAGVAAMARAETVAVLLPGAFYFLREQQRPPLDALRRHGVRMALATDNNPGSSPIASPLLVLNFACTLFGMTPEEALAGLTRNGAAALGMGATHGTLDEGKQADFALWEIGQPAELAYAIGANPCVAVVRAGEIVHRA
jgi:imidazolonepropionase